jgi:hypothetical protein
MYLDNILIFLTNLSKHSYYVRQVLEQLLE